MPTVSDFSAELTPMLGTTAVVTVAGELDLLSAPALRDALHEAARPRPETLVVDLAGLEFMDSSGLHVLLEADHAARRAGGRLVIVSAATHIRSTIEAAGLLGRLDVAHHPLTPVG